MNNINKTSLISVIIPIYNAEKYIENCVNSVRNQTLREIEIILIDDGSLDKSGVICDKFAQEDERIVTIHKKNEGLVAARKSGLKIANGKYIGYVDADDFVESEYFEKMYLIAEKSHADVVACGYTLEDGKNEIIKENSIPSGIYVGTECRKLYEYMIYNGQYYKFGIIPNVWNKLFHKEKLWECQMKVPEQIRLGEDVACTYNAIMNANCIVIDNSCVMYHYRMVCDSMTKRIDRKGYESLNVLYMYLKETLGESRGALEQLEYYKTYLLDLEWKRIWERQNAMDYKNRKKLMEPLYKSYENLLQKFPHDLPWLLKVEIFCVKQNVCFLLPIIVSIRKAFKMC